MTGGHKSVNLLVFVFSFGEKKGKREVVCPSYSIVQLMRVSYCLCRINILLKLLYLQSLKFIRERSVDRSSQSRNVQLYKQLM